MLKKRELYQQALTTFDETLKDHLQHEIDRLLSFQDTFERLRSALNEYEAYLNEAYKQNEFIEKGEFLKLKTISLALLNVCERDPWQDYVPMCLVAIKYFLEPDDADSDFAGLGGHKDDTKVMHTIIKSSGLELSVESECLKIDPAFQKSKEKLSA